MSDLADLYQQTILEHNRRPRNFKKLEPADRSAEGNNPLCGDHLTVYLRLDDDVIKAIDFQGEGCAISTASASLMTTAVAGKSHTNAERLFPGFHEMETGGLDASVEPRGLGELAALARS